MDISKKNTLRFQIPEDMDRTNITSSRKTKDVFDNINTQIGLTVSPNLVLDMSKVRFIDTFGLSLLMDICKKLQKGELVLLDVTRNVENLIRLVRLDTVFKIEKTEK